MPPKLGLPESLGEAGLVASSAAKGKVEHGELQARAPPRAPKLGVSAGFLAW